MGNLELQKRIIEIRDQMDSTLNRMEGMFKVSNERINRYPSLPTENQKLNWRISKGLSKGAPPHGKSNIRPLVAVRYCAANDI